MLGPFNVRYEARFVDGVEDERPSPPVVDTNGVTRPVTVTCGKRVDGFTSHNLYVNWDAPWETTVTLGIMNLTDEDPPQVRHRSSYDCTLAIRSVVYGSWESRKMIGGD